MTMLHDEMGIIDTLFLFNNITLIDDYVT